MQKQNYKQFMNTYECEKYYLKALEVLVHNLEKKERKLETNMSLYFRIMEVGTKDMGYKPQPSTHLSYLACHYFIAIEKLYPIVIIKGEDKTFAF